MTKKPTKTHGTGYTRAADILAAALVSDKPEIMEIEKLDPAVRSRIVAGRLFGYRPVSVRWPTGEFALMFCEPGSNMPHPAKVVAAYRQCRAGQQVFPSGSQP